MLSVGEFSKICQVSVKTLRHYDKIGLLKPARVDGETGYRYYDAEQIDRMLLIGRFKRYGFSLGEIQELLNITDEGQLALRLREQRKKLQSARRETAVVLNELTAHINVFERTGDIMTYQKGYTIEIKNSPRINALSVRDKMSVDDFGRYYGRLYERVPHERVTPNGITAARYFDEEFDRDLSDIELLIGIREAEKTDTVLEPVECAFTLHRGAYSTLPEAYGALVTWIMENGCAIAGAPFEIYVKTQFDSLSPEEWETEVYFPIKKK